MKKVMLALGIIVCLASVAVADEVELPAQKDSYIEEYAPDANNGNADYLQLYANWTHPAETRSTTLICFDLAPYMGTVIDDAVLRLYVLPTGLQPGNIDVYRIADEWDENIVTWDNAPPDAQPPIVTEPLPPGTRMWFEVPVTGFVQDWVDGTVSNHGFYLSVPDQGVEIFAHLASKELSDPDIHPILWLNYHGGGVSEERKDDAVRLHVSSLSFGAIEVNFSLSTTTSATLKVYDASGALVQTLMDESVGSGDHYVIWDGAPGVYFVRLETPNSTSVRKLVLVR